MFRIERTDQLAALLEDSDRWDSLAGGNPFRESPWLKPWWDLFGDYIEPYALIARDFVGEIRGVLPLYRKRLSSQHRTLGNLGDGPARTDHVAVLAQPEHAEAIGYAFGRFLANSAGSNEDGWETLTLEGVRDREPSMLALVQGLQDHRAVVHSHSSESSWTKPCQRSWDDYLASLESRTRQRMHRLLDRCDDCGPFALAVADRREDAYRIAEQILEMQHQRRSQSRSTGHQDPALRQFIRDVVDRFFLRGRLHLASLQADEQTVAGIICFEGGDRQLYCYSTGYDSRHAGLQPGLVLSAAMLRRSHAQGLRGIDFLRGDEPFKVRLRAEPRRLISFRVVAPSLLPRLRHAAWITGFGFKQFVRKRTGQKPIQVLDLNGNV